MGKDIRTITNPYEYNSHKLDKNSFVGRSQNIRDFYGLIDDFNENGKIPNVIVTGEKSIGKSSLIHQFSKYIQSARFFVFNRELSGNISEYQLVKEIFDKVYTEVAPVDKTCLSSYQQEIWFTLTEAFENHKSSFMDREIRFATSYWKHAEGKGGDLDYNTLLADFRKIVGALKEVGYKGVAIFIDEFQELASNPRLISLLRQLTEDMDDFLVVGAGLPVVLSNNHFDKFRRTSKVQSLVGLSREVASENWTTR
ncbi:AAA ATPase domain-containing protein (fragment) [Pseudodesulfovibrio profundus]|uniref:AAA ATPase domain-containing protein n=1 Tax=Pseudodesulfovibrio profundus TaxID=57320 RepID=A0A2C8F7P6_9BACT